MHFNALQLQLVSYDFILKQHTKAFNKTGVFLKLWRT